MKLGGGRLEEGCDALQAGSNVRVGMTCPREASIQLSEVQSPGRVVGVDDDSGVFAGGGQDGGSWVVEALQVNSIAELQGDNRKESLFLSSSVLPSLQRPSVVWLALGSPSFSSMTIFSPSRL